MVLLEFAEKPKAAKVRAWALSTAWQSMKKNQKQLAKKIKQACSSGGSIKPGSVEIQGDHREKIKTLLEKEGFTVKLSGG